MTHRRAERYMLNLGLKLFLSSHPLPPPATSTHASCPHPFIRAVARLHYITLHWLNEILYKIFFSLSSCCYEIQQKGKRMDASLFESLIFSSILSSVCLFFKNSIEKLKVASAQFWMWWPHHTHTCIHHFYFVSFSFPCWSSCSYS